MKAYQIGESIIFSSCLSSARLLAFSRCERYQHMSEVEKGEEIPWLSGMQKKKGLAGPYSIWADNGHRQQESTRAKCTDCGRPETSWVRQSILKYGQCEWCRSGRFG